jgi:uncharacterized protein YktA (UPF0223 family)
MKAKDFGKFVGSLAEVLGAAGATEQAGAWHSILRIFQAKPSSKVSDVCQILSDIDVNRGNQGMMVEKVIAFMPPLRRCLSESAKNKALMDDLELFGAVLAPYAGFPISNFADAAVARLSWTSADLVAHYLRRLEESLRNESAFLEVFNKLKKDTAVKAAEAKQLARAFAKASGRSKEEALDRIWSRHASLIGVGARAKATGGRTAA